MWFLWLLPATSFGEALTHGWDCIACGTNSMLAGDFAIFDPPFSNEDPWWVSVIGTYNAVVTHAAGDSQYNGTGEYASISLSRTLKEANPKLKTMWYQACDRGDLSPWGQEQIQAHPEW